MRALRAIALCALLSACSVDEPTTFGQPCTNPDICGGLQCRPSPVDGELRCLPTRTPTEPGEQCTAPFVSTSPGAGKVILDQLVYVGGATDETQLSCNAVAVPEVVVRFTVADDDGNAATEAPGVRIRLDGDTAAHFALSLRAAGCGAELAFGCKAPGASDILLEALAPGDYELVVEGSPVGSGATEQPAHVVVERLDCPPHALPFDADSCVRNTTMPSSLRARVGHTAHALEDGTVVVIGGDSGTGPRSDFEVLDPALGRWAFGSLAQSTSGHASVPLSAGRLIVLSSRAQFIDIDAFRAATPSSDVEIVAASRPLSIAVATDNGILAIDANGTRRFSVTPQGTSFSLQQAYDAPAPILADGMQLLPTRARTALLAGAGGETTDLSLLTIGNESFLFSPIANAEARTHAALVSVSPNQVLVVGGFRRDGAITRTIERFDSATRAIESSTTGALAPLPRDVTHPRAAMLDDLLLVIGDESTPVLMNPTTGDELRAPSILARTGARLVASDNAVTIVGGAVAGVPASTVERIELVGRTAPAAQRGACLTTAIGDSAGPFTARIAGDTSDDEDEFRTERCGTRGDYNYGRDEFFTFSITEPSSLQVEALTDDDGNDGDAHRMMLLRGTCTSREEVACSADDALAMFVGELVPGDYTLVVEHAYFSSTDKSLEFAGAGFSARVQVGAPQQCPLDANDPADDVVSGAGVCVAESPSAATLLGRLCPGDIDHVLFEFNTDDDVDFVGIPDGLVTFQEASIATEATRAAGRPIASGVFGPRLSTLNGEDAGIYVATLALPPDAVDYVGWRVQHTFACTRDARDSLVPALDNANLAFAETLTPSDTLDLHFCVANDRDTLIIDPAGSTGALTLSMNAPADGSTRLEFFSLVDNALGAPLPLVAQDDPRSTLGSIVDLGVLTAPIAVRVSVSSVGVSRRLRLAALQDGDTCDNALPLVVDNATSGTVTGDTTAFSDNHNAVRLGDCTGYTEPGADTVYAVDLDDGAALQLVATGLQADVDGNGVFDDDPTRPDVSVYILQDCEQTEASCTAGIDVGVRGEPETLTVTNDTGAPGTFFVVFDSFYGEAYSWQLEWSISAP